MLGAAAAAAAVDLAPRPRPPAPALAADMDFGGLGGLHQVLWVRLCSGLGFAVAGWFYLQSCLVARTNPTRIGSARGILAQARELLSMLNREKAPTITAMVAIIFFPLTTATANLVGSGAGCRAGLRSPSSHPHGPATRARSCGRALSDLLSRALLHLNALALLAFCNPGQGSRLSGNSAGQSARLHRGRFRCRVSLLVFVFGAFLLLGSQASKRAPGLPLELNALTSSTSSGCRTATTSASTSLGQ